MATYSRKEQELLEQALRARERETHKLEERVRDQDEAMQNLNALLEQSDRAIGALTTLQTVFGGSQSVREQADAFLELAMRASRCEAGVLALREGTQAHLAIVAAAGDRSHIVRQQVFNEGEGILGEVTRTGDPLLVADARREPRLRREGADYIQIDARNSLCVPVPGPGRFAGAILLVNTVGRKRFTRQDIELQTIMASRLGREVEREADLTRARDEVARFSTLLRVTELLHVATEPQKVSDLIVQLATRLGKAQGAAVYLADESQHLLTLTACSDRSTGTVQVPVGSGVAGWVALEGLPLIVRPAADPRFAGQVEAAFGFRVDTAAALPIRSGSRLVGVLEVANKTGGAVFDQADLAPLTILAREAGIALERLQQTRQDQRTIIELLRGLARFIDAKAPHLAGHSERVAKISQTIGEEMGMTSAEATQLYLAGLLHDLGNLGLDDELFLAPRALTDAETLQMRKHPAAGAEILREVSALRHVVPGALHHHERYDGTGYPQGLRGEAIPQSARILAVAEAFDACRSARPYRKALALPEAMAHVRQGEGALFDPKVVAALLSAYQRGRLPA